MAAAGSGVRWGFGLFVLILHALTFAGSLLLIYWRRKYQPAKVNSPFMMFVLCFHMIPLAILVPIRELGIWQNASCETVLWLVCISTLWLCAPQGTCLYRLYLVHQYEQQKAAYALRLKAGSPSNSVDLTSSSGDGKNGGVSGAGGLAGLWDWFKKRHSNTRMLVVTALIGLPGFVYLPVFFALSSSPAGGAAPPADGGGAVVGCPSYHDAHFAIPWWITFAWCNVCGMCISLLARDVKHDAWSLRWHMNVNVVYGNFFMISFILLNVLWPDVNASYFESAYAIELWSLISIWQCVWRPCIQTFWTKQKAPKGTFIPGASHGHTPRGNGEKGIKYVIGPNPNANANANGTTPGGGLNSTRANRANSNPAAMGLTIPIGNLMETSRNGAYTSHNTSHEASGATAGGGGRNLNSSRGRPNGQTHSFAHRPLMRLLSDPDGLHVFVAYTQSEFSSENVLFFTAVNDFRAAPSLLAATELYSTFVGANSRMQVNLSSNVTRAIQAGLERERLMPTLPNGVNEANVIHVQASPAPTARSGTVPSNGSGGATTPLLNGTGATVASGGGGGGELSYRSAIGISASAGGASLAVPAIAISTVSTPTHGSGGGGSSGGASAAVTSRTSPRGFASLYDDAQREVFLMLESDSFARFVMTHMGRATMDAVEEAHRANLAANTIALAAVQAVAPHAVTNGGMPSARGGGGGLPSASNQSPIHGGGGSGVIASVGTPSHTHGNGEYATPSHGIRLSIRNQSTPSAVAAGAGTSSSTTSTTAALRTAAATASAVPTVVLEEESPPAAAGRAFLTTPTTANRTHSS